MNETQKKQTLALYERQAKRLGAKVSSKSLTYKYRWIIDNITPLYQMGATVLDVGCQAGGLSILLSMVGYKCTGYDVSSTYLAYTEDNAKRCKVDIKLVQGFAEELDKHELPKFNIVVMSSVLEHLREPALVFNKAKTLVKSLGRILIIVPMKDSWPEYDHVYKFDLDTMERVFKGCTIGELIFNQNSDVNHGWYTAIYDG